MADSGGDIKDLVCLQKLSWKTQNGFWLYVLHMGLVSAAHSWCLARRAGHAVQCGWGVSYAS